MKYSLLHEPRKIFDYMLKDIASAKKEILLETYIYDKDKIGKEFRDLIIKKAKEGVKVRLLIDWWGGTAKKSFFRELISLGGEVRYFRKLRLSPKIFRANHERNHRKLLIIDEKIAYIGSINITNSCIDWKEIVFRMDGLISKAFKKAFKRTWRIHNLFKNKNAKKIIYEGFEILEDIADGKHNVSARTYHKLIKNSKEEVLIVTPYFLPSKILKRDFKKAIKRGVKVSLILPENSDVTTLDKFRNRHLGKLHKIGVNIYFYPKVLHSKILVSDNQFLIGSSNLDYRSFRHQFEINLFGKDEQMTLSLKKHIQWFIKNSKKFDFEKWKKRHYITRKREEFLSWFLRNWEEYF